MSVGEGDINRLQYSVKTRCGACEARAGAGILGPCPTCFRRDHPNPFYQQDFSQQDGTATSVGCPSPGTRLDLGVGKANAVTSAGRPMTDAERKLVEAALVFGDQGEGYGPFKDAVDEVAAERKPPEPRPITPEELAVVEAARLVGKRLDVEFAAGVYGPMKDDSRALIDAVRRLPLTGVNGKSGVPYP